MAKKIYVCVCPPLPGKNEKNLRASPRRQILVAPPLGEGVTALEILLILPFPLNTMNKRRGSEVGKWPHSIIDMISPDQKF